MLSLLRTFFLVIYTIWVLLLFTAGALVLVLPLSLLLPKITWRRQVGRLTAKTCFALAAMPIRIQSTGHLPKQGCIVVANHASYLDGPLLSAVLPTSFCMVIKREAGDIPLVGLLLKRLDHQLVERHNPRGAARDAKAMLARINAGQALGIFPEGTFVAEAGIGRFKSGAFVSAIAAHANVVPVGIRGTRHIFPAKQKLLRPGRIVIAIGEPITPQPCTASKREQAKQLAELARSKVAQLAEENLND